MSTAVPEQLERASTRSAASEVAHNSGLLSVSAGVVGVVSYICTLLMANALSSQEYSNLAAAQMLLGIVGIVSSALVPLPLSHAVATNAAGSAGRRDGLAFALTVSVAAGIVAAGTTGAVVSAFGSPVLALVAALTAFVLFVVAAPLGWLQGELRFVRYAAASIAEVLVRLGFSVLVIALAWGATGAVLGFALGALVILAVPRSFYRDITWRPQVLRDRWRWSETGDIALTLCIVTVLTGADVVVMSFLDGGTDAAAGFQALSTIAKGPIYVAAGTVLVAFPLLRRAGADRESILVSALRSFGLLAIAACVVIATVPAPVVELVLPEKFHPSIALLPWLAGAGLGYAVLTVLATILLALRAYRRCQLGLIAATVLLPAGMAVGWSVGGVPGVAVGTAAASLASAAVLAIIAFPLLPRSTRRLALQGLLAGAVLSLLLLVAGLVPPLWILVVLMTGFGILAGQRRSSAPETEREAEPARPVRRGLRAPERFRPTRSGLLGFIVVACVAFGARAVGLARGFELWVDEMLYARLGYSVSLGEIPNLPDGPFMLHPPGYFLLEGAVISVFGISGDNLDLVLQLRWLNAVLGAVSVGLAFLLVRTVANMPAAWITAVVMTLEPFVLRNNSRVFLETFGMAVMLAGLLVLVSLIQRNAPRYRVPRLAVAGLLLGFAVLTKDVFVLGAVAPILIAALWRRTLAVRDSLTVVAAALVPYTVYLLVLGFNGLLDTWLWAKGSGVRRAIGLEQSTGFNAEGAPGILGRVLDQIGQFGSSYLLLALAPLTGLLLCFSAIAARRLLGLVALMFGLFGLYSAAFGTLEEQYGYPVLVAGVLSTAVYAVELVERRPSWRTPVILFAAALTALTAVFGLRAMVTVDNGFVQARDWANANLPADARVSVTNSTGELAFESDSRFGVWPSAPLLEANDANYVLTQDHPTSMGYGYAQPAMLEWLETNAQPVFSAEGPTNGNTVIWQIDDETRRSGAAENIGFPSATYETER
ncbi:MULTISPECIES: glycosyltransferase family 39 protein [unclassified Arthrobacter]|uniref:glycosyltransferase family 39 protein n=1 Tax=unclassified Arthrobacter TaxID=235627 RepID=UPI0024DF9BD5|nr:MULTISPECIES: glycosyltransferase family 39 protein [unclassified Arthrobacter]MCC9144280.1 glycosyltransferase family 39 protein [Arthrobacter sp. zg-Y919]MDK1275505.1 glycosyltransferase family 39 protein [Arthrobacter sp. zg.Y919]WIB03120.1 glycosyltransferase family 39 protein [Arthrobacter sp. zg-Y919]